MVPREGVDAFVKQTGWHVSTPEQRELAAENLESGSAAQQALAAGEQVVRAGTLGIAPGLEGWQQREKVLRRESPIISGVAQGVGAVAPALATGGLAGGLAGAAGLGARGAAAVALAGEGLAGGFADELEQARYESRDVSVGNVMLYGLGGELVGRALPHALSMGAGRIKRALTGAEAAAGDGLQDALVATEGHAVKNQAELATELPVGSPERREALRATASQQYDQMATEGAAELDTIADLTSKMGDTSSSPKVVARLRETLAEDSPAQTDWFTAQKQRLSQLKDDLRAPMERTGPPTLDEYVATIKTDAGRQKAIDEVTDEVVARANKRGLNRPEGADWSPVQTEELAKIQDEVLIEWSPKPRGLRDSAGLQGFSKRADQIIEGTLGKLDRTTDTAEQYLLARHAKKQLQQLSKKMSLVKGPQDAILHEEMRGLIDDAWRGVNEGLKDRALFGAAADIEADINGAWSDKVLRGLGVAEGDLARKVDVDFKTGRTLAEYDPRKVRSFLQGDAVDRALAQGKLAQVLEGAEEMAAAHERHGTWAPDQIAKLRDSVARVRQKLSLAEELQAAKNAVDDVGEKAGKTVGQQATDAVKGYAVSRAAGAAGAAAGGLIGGPVGAALGWGVGEVASAVGKRLVGIDAAARAATKQTARNLAGVGLGYAQRVAGNVSRGMAGGALAAGAMTAIARFQGDYPDAHASFEAKRKVLDQHQLQPEVLYETLGNALGDLPKVRPDLFQAIVKRTSQKVRFIRENLPPGLAASLLYPNGTPPSQSDLRDFATLWNTVMDPQTVLQDIDAGTATRQQMDILKKSDRDLYDQLRGDIIEMVGTHFKDVPTSTKASLDLLLGADGLAGPIFSSAAARYVGDAKKAAAERGQRPPPPPTPQQGAGAAGPAGLNAIQTSVTNRTAA